jgi:hypothetical protein
MTAGVTTDWREYAFELTVVLTKMICQKSDSEKKWIFLANQKKAILIFDA